MRITERRLRGIIREEILREATVGSELPDDHWAQYLNILNPVDAFQNYMNDSAVAAGSRQLAKRLTRVPLLGSSAAVAQAIFAGMDRNPKLVAIKLMNAILDTAMISLLGAFSSGAVPESVLVGLVYGFGIDKADDELSLLVQGGYVSDEDRKQVMRMIRDRQLMEPVVKAQIESKR